MRAGTCATRLAPLVLVPRKEVDFNSRFQGRYTQKSNFNIHARVGVEVSRPPPVRARGESPCPRRLPGQTTLSSTETARRQVVSKGAVMVVKKGTQSIFDHLLE